MLSAGFAAGESATLPEGEGEASFLRIGQLNLNYQEKSFQKISRAFHKLEIHDVL